MGRRPVVTRTSIVAVRPHVQQDGEGDWQTRTDAYKEEQYSQLRDNLAGLLPGWKVKTTALSLGIRWSFNEEKWRTDLERRKVPRPAMDKLMLELVANCIVS